MPMKQIVLACIFTVSCLFSFAQNKTQLSEKEWADSVFNSLSPQEKIAQLIIIRAHSNLGADHVAAVTDLISKYNVGALCFFQGGPVHQANLTNYYQSIAKTPLLVSIDGEFGLGMRLDSVTKFPYQSTLGAVPDESVIYKMGLAVGEQMKRLGVHINYAPTIDINNNPNNPVIGYRSFGEDRERVSRFGAAYMKGMQDAGIMAVAKHFPGHGDTEVDSHLDLPVINKTKGQVFTQCFIQAKLSLLIQLHYRYSGGRDLCNRGKIIYASKINGVRRRGIFKIAKGFMIFYFSILYSQHNAARKHTPR